MDRCSECGNTRRSLYVIAESPGVAVCSRCFYPLARECIKRRRADPELKAAYDKVFSLLTPAELERINVSERTKVTEPKRDAPADNREEEEKAKALYEGESCSNCGEHDCVVRIAVPATTHCPDWNQAAPRTRPRH